MRLLVIDYTNIDMIVEVPGVKVGLPKMAVEIEDVDRR
jgi:hypothetical protein